MHMLLCRCTETRLVDPAGRKVYSERVFVLEAWIIGAHKKRLFN